MRRILSLMLLLAVTSLASVSTARAQLGNPTSWFPVNGGIVTGVLPHSDGTVWVGTVNGLYRYTRAGVLLGQVTTAAVSSMALAPNGDVVMLDYWNRDVLRYTSSGAPVRSWANPHAAREGGRVVVDAADNVYVLCFTAGFASSALVKYDAVGNELAYTPGLNGSDGLALTGGTLYVAEIYGNVIHSFDTSLGAIGSFPMTSQYATEPRADNAGNLLLNDYYARSVKRFTTTGTLLGTTVNNFPGYFPFWRPAVACQAQDGTYFVGDSENWYVLVFGELATPTQTTTWGAVKAGTR